MTYFSKDNILHIHSKLVRYSGGTDGIRDEGMLDSALYAPLQTFDSIDLYPTDVDKITRLSFGLVMNHPFLDGNKRIAAHVLYVGLKANNIVFIVKDEEMIDKFLDLAASRVTYEEFLAWVKSKIE